MELGLRVDRGPVVALPLVTLGPFFLQASVCPSVVADCACHTGSHEPQATVEGKCLAQGRGPDEEAPLSPSIRGTGNLLPHPAGCSLRALLPSWAPSSQGLHVRTAVSVRLSSGSRVRSCSCASVRSCNLSPPVVFSP